MTFNEDLLAAVRLEALDPASDCPSDAIVVYLGEESLMKHHVERLTEV